MEPQNFLGLTFASKVTNCISMRRRRRTALRGSRSTCLFFLTSPQQGSTIPGSEVTICHPLKQQTNGSRYHALPFGSQIQTVTQHRDNGSSHAVYWVATADRRGCLLLLNPSRSLTITCFDWLWRSWVSAYREMPGTESGIAPGQACAWPLCDGAVFHRPVPLGTPRL